MPGMRLSRMTVGAVFIAVVATSAGSEARESKPPVEVVSQVADVEGDVVAFSPDGP
jgi:hypothetical protein